MKKMFLLAVVALFLSSCQKDSLENFPKCFNVPDSKSIPNHNFLNKDVQIEIKTQQEKREIKIASKISTIDDMKYDDVIIGKNLKINLLDTGNFFYAIRISILEMESPYVCALNVYTQQGVWNSSSVGVYDTGEEIILTANGVENLSQKNSYLCIRIVIVK